jgi:hypothetical protein
VPAFGSFEFYKGLTKLVQQGPFPRATVQIFDPVALRACKVTCLGKHPT